MMRMRYRVNEALTSRINESVKTQGLVLYTWEISYFKQFAFPKFIKTGADLASNGIVGRNLGTKQKVTSQIRPHNTIVDEFGTSLSLNFGKANTRKFQENLN